MNVFVLLSLVVGSPPKLDALVAAANKKDPVELDRVARRLGAGRLLHALASDRVEVRRAALEAAPRVDESWTLLAPCARLCASSDDQVAQAAARATRRIAAQLTSGRDDLAELPRDVPREAVRVLMHVARSPDVMAARRADALGALVVLAPLSAPPRNDLLPLLDDAATEVRRAAVDLLATELIERGAGAPRPAEPPPKTSWGQAPSSSGPHPPLAAVDLLARVVERDAQPQVAGGAAAAVCTRLPRAQAAAWTRLRALALDAKVDPADALELLSCLAAGSAEERALVTQAAKSHPTPLVRAAAVDLAKTAAAGPPAILRPVSTPR